MNLKKIIEVIKKEAFSYEWGLRLAKVKEFVFYIDKKLRLQYYDLDVTGKMVFREKEHGKHNIRNKRK